MSTEPKVPAAVVYLERADGRVLALTRGDDYADWHLPGGKWEPRDGHVVKDPDDHQRAPNLVTTAIREVQEETGLWLACADLRPIHQYVTTANPRRPGSGGRPVTVFLVEGCTWTPESFARYPAGQPAWVPPELLTVTWASFAHEAGIALAAARHRASAAPGGGR